MARYIFLAFTNPTPGNEDEFNRWYDEQHIPDVVDVPGFVAGQRFRLADTTFEFNQTPQKHRYLALYEMETDDPAASFKELIARVGTPKMVMSEAIDMSTLSAPLFEQIGERVLAADVRRKRGSAA